MCGSNRLRGIDLGVPYDLIVNILEKLPIKSIVRFKYVSKQWFELITDTYFTYRHLSNQTKKDPLFFSVCFTSIPVRYLPTSKRRLPMESMVVATDSTLSYSHTHG
ncbi:hypothetical protein like AT1G47300 [Hibiscus trionum]|uniref:F-box domain-containing protein n=1 Tax=Hibiscus trionum TaxID=183268 RepID=A0A9W7MT86_HIBTR|nr:hypothetical protein like AT1G47300 [Hibiscus trionum]